MQSNVSFLWTRIENEVRLVFMEINGAYFLPLPGTVYVVTYPGDKVAQGVFKTMAAAKKLAARMDIKGEIRVGHFEGSKIVTI